MQIPIESFFIETRSSQDDVTRLTVKASNLDNFKASTRLGRYPIYLSVLGMAGPRLFGPVQPQLNVKGETVYYLYSQADKGLQPECKVYVLNE